MRDKTDNNASPQRHFSERMFLKEHRCSMTGEKGLSTPCRSRRPNSPYNSVALVLKSLRECARVYPSRQRRCNVVADSYCNSMSSVYICYCAACYCAASIIQVQPSAVRLRYHGLEFDTNMSKEFSLIKECGDRVRDARVFK